MENTLSARGIDVSVASKHRSTSTVGACDTILVRIRAGRVIAPADRDMVDLVDRVRVWVVCAANALAQELVPEVVAHPDEGPLHLMISGRLICDLVLVARPKDILAVDRHPRLVDVVPVRTPLQIPLIRPRAVDNVGVNGIVGAAASGSNYNSLVLPRAGLQRR